MKARLEFTIENLPQILEYNGFERNKYYNIHFMSYYLKDFREEKIKIEWLDSEKDISIIIFANDSTLICKIHVSKEFVHLLPKYINLSLELPVVDKPINLWEYCLQNGWKIPAKQPRFAQKNTFECDGIHFKFCYTLKEEKDFFIIETGSIYSHKNSKFYIPLHIELCEQIKLLNEYINIFEKK